MFLIIIFLILYIICDIFYFKENFKLSFKNSNNETKCKCDTKKEKKKVDKVNKLNINNLENFDYKKYNYSIYNQNNNQINNENNYKINTAQSKFEEKYKYIIYPIN